MSIAWHPNKHSPRLLHQWKADAEADGGLDALRKLDGLLEESRLAELIEQAVTRLGPTREVTVTLDGGMLHEGHQTVRYPLAKGGQAVSSRPHHGPAGSAGGPT